MLLAATTVRRHSPSEPTVRCDEKRSFTSHDGSALFYRCWPAARGTRRDAVLLLHREHEHAGRVQHLVEELGLDGCSFFAWDARGHGCSPGPRGDAPSVGCLEKDLDAFVRHIGQRHDIACERIHVVALGASGVLAAAWVHDYAPRIASMVIAAGAFECRGFAALSPRAMKALYRRRSHQPLVTYARADDLTQDLARRTAYRSDPLIGRTTTARLLIGLQETARRILTGAGSIAVPTQVLIAGDDRLVRHAPQRAFFDALGATDKEIHVFDGLRHDLLGERDRQIVLEHVRRFILAHRARASDGQPSATAQSSAASASRAGATVSSLPFENLRLYAVRASARAAGRISTGSRLALEHGLESHDLIDHVIRNRAEGTNALGRILDRRFLDSLPARSLRVRSLHLQRAVAAAMQRMRTTGLPVRIVGVAAGMHLLDTIRSLTELPESVLLHDTNPDAVARGHRLIQENNLQAIARCQRVERMDGAWIASLVPHTTIAVAALHDGAAIAAMPVEDVLGGLSRAVPPGGCLVYSSGPHHVDWQHHAIPIDCRRATLACTPPRSARRQADLDRCIEAAGFRPLDRWVDEWGVFSVSLCVRAGAEAAR